MNQDFNKLYQLIQEKHRIQSIDAPERTNPHLYVEELLKEIVEIKNEIKPKNVIHLQDELADWLWDLLSLIEALKQKWLIDWLDDVLNHAVHKYTQRVAVCTQEWWRKQIKEQQKIELAQKHKERYRI